VSACALLAKLRFPGQNVLFLVLLSTMMIPTQAILVSQSGSSTNLVCWAPSGR
jgi:ABC-type glycerol-3-phosphate transport system permease component